MRVCAVDEFVHDDAVDLGALLGVGAGVLDVALGELLGVDAGFDEPLGSGEGDAAVASSGGLVGDDLGDVEPGQGELGVTWSMAWWMVLSGQMRKSAPAAWSLLAEESMMSPTVSQSPRWMGSM